MSERGGGDRMASGWLGRWEDGWRNGGMERWKGAQLTPSVVQADWDGGQGRKVVAMLEVEV